MTTTRMASTRYDPDRDIYTIEIPGELIDRASEAVTVTIQQAIYNLRIGRRCS